MEQLHSVGLTVETTTFNPDAEGYTVVAASWRRGDLASRTAELAEQ